MGPVRESIDRQIILSYALTGAAIAGPLFGTIAGSYKERWNPLLTGCALGLFTLFIMYALI